MRVDHGFQFSTYGAFFFRQAGLSDPFAVTCIKSGIGLAMNIIAVLSVEKVGRRLFCCSGLTLMLLMNLAIGILGVQQRSTVVDNLLVFFSVMWCELLLLCLLGCSAIHKD